MYEDFIVCLIAWGVLITIGITLVVVIIRTISKTISQKRRNKKIRSAKNKMIDDYIKEISDNNHNADK